MAGTGVAPTVRAERIDTLDIVRGFALFGILLMNIVGMGLAQQAYFNPAATGDPTQSELTTWFITHTFFEGSMRTLFSMLFGAGFVLLLDRLDAKNLGLGGAKIYMRRMLFLMLFGLINMGLLAWYGDIVFAYGVCGIFLLVFYKSKLRGLIIWAAIFFAMTSLFNAGGGYKAGKLADATAEAELVLEAGEILTEEQESTIENFAEMSEFFTSDPDVVADGVAHYEDGWLAVGGHNLGEFFTMGVGMMIPSLLLDPLAAMLLGMIAFRIGLLRGEWGWKSVLALTAVALAIGIPVNLRETMIIQDGGFTVEAIFQSLATYDLGRVSLAFAWLGIFLLLAKTPLFGVLKATVGAVGRMALTNYLGHSLMAAIFFLGMGYFGQLGRDELYLVVAAMWAINIVVSVVWLSVFSMGPLEWLWRAGTYGTWPKLFKSKPAPEPVREPVSEAGT